MQIGGEGGESRRGAILRAALALAVAGAIGALLCSAASAQPAGRAYELISPVEKNYGDILRVPPAAHDGNTIPYGTVAAVDDAAGAQVGSYTIARRTPSGWVRTDANAASLRAPSGVAPSVPVQFSSDFSKLIIDTSATFDPDDQDGTRGDLYRVLAGTGTATWLSHGPTVPDSTSAAPRFVWASASLDHVVFSMTGTNQLLPGAGSDAVYELIGGQLRLVGYPPGVDTPAAQAFAAARATQRGGLEPAGDTAVPHGGAHAVSENGRRIYVGIGTDETAAQLHLREDGTRTIPVSISERADTAGTLALGRFIAADPNGEVAYFTSGTPLTDDAGAGNNVYRFSRLSEPEDRLRVLTTAGGTISSALASADGRSLYFVSTAAMADGAVQGQRNAYRWAGGALMFIATIGSNGVVTRVSRDGRFAVIRTSASIAGAPNAGRRALYVYDEGERTLRCASCRPDGTPSSADATLDAQPEAAIDITVTSPRSLTDDGALYFATADPLIPADANETADVYEYDHGTTSLISSGTSPYDSYVGDNSDDGRSVFFTTRASLLPQDVDAQLLDLYVARTGGGFPQPPTPPAPCAGDACQGSLSPPPALPAPRSVAHGPIGNVTPAAEAPRSIGLLALNRAARRRFARTGKTSLRVRIVGGGAVTVRAKGTLKGQIRRLGTARRAVEKTAPTTVRVRLRLSKAARRHLHRGKRLRVSIRARVREQSVRDQIKLTLRGARR